MVRYVMAKGVMVRGKKCHGERCCGERCNGLATGFPTVLFEIPRASNRRNRGAVQEPQV